MPSPDEWRGHGRNYHRVGGQIVDHHGIRADPATSPIRRVYPLRFITLAPVPMSTSDPMIIRSSEPMLTLDPSVTP